MDIVMASFLGDLLGSVAPMGRFALSMVVSTAGSYAEGKLIKHKTPLPNRGIPAYNAATWGGGAAALGGDPETIGGAIVGSLIAWGVHQAKKKLGAT